MFSDPQKNIEQFAVDPGNKVADMGSGAGFYTLSLAQAVGNTGTVYAIDVQQDLLAKLRNEATQNSLDNIEIIWGDIEEVKGTKLKDDSVDKVVLANVLFQTQHKDAVISEAFRILKSKGTLMFIDWSDSFGGLGPAKHYLVTPDQAKTLFDKAGFEFVRDVTAGAHHYGMIFRKI